MFERTRRIFRITCVVWKYHLFSSLLGFYRGFHKGVVPGEPLCAPSEGWEKEGARLRKGLTELGPTFIKLGQLLSKRPDIMPSPIIAELQKLQGEVEPVPFEQISRSVIYPSKDMVPACRRLEDIFDDITLLASASIAQVYRAKLRGNDVAVKVLKPDIERVIDADLKLLRLLLPLGSKLLRIKGFDAQVLVDELSTMLQNEIDMRLEALHIESFVRRFKSWDNVVIPHVYWEYTTNRVLVMDYVKGQTVASHPSLDEAHARVYANLITKSFLKMVYVDGFYHADPHSGNILILEGGKIAFLDFGAVGRLREELKRDAFEVFYAFYQGDVSKALKGFMKLLGVTKKDIDIDAFYADLDALIEKFQAARFEKGQGDNLARLAFKYGLPAPRAFMMLERAIMLVEGVCNELYPYFDIKEAMAEQFSVTELARLELERGVKRLTEVSVKLFRCLPDIVDRYIEGTPELIRDQQMRLYPSKAPYVIAAIIASIGLLFPLCSALGVLEMPFSFMLYVLITALVLAALVTIAAVLK
jgi:ubiquinone biosynthesis protein